MNYREEKFYHYPYGNTTPRPMERFDEVLEACQQLIDRNTHKDKNGDTQNDMRFCQMLANMFQKNGINSMNDLYNIEDPGFVAMVRNYPFPVK